MDGLVRRSEILFIQVNNCGVLVYAATVTALKPKEQIELKHISAPKINPQIEILCFVLDLRSLSPPLVGDIKQSLLQLANFYAISSSIGQRSHSKPLPNRLGLCYIINNRISSSSELNVAYIPRGEFSLRDFHHSVTNLPSDAFLPTYNSSGDVSCDDFKLSSILSDKVLYSWKGDNKDITRKVILIGSNLVQNIDSVTKDTLMDAADKCVSVEFVLLEQKLSHLCDLPETINKFDKQISELENCSFRAFFPGGNVFPVLVKQWLQDLKDDMEEQQAQFIFKRDLAGSLKQIYCNLCSSYSPMIDGFTPCQTCRCHGMPLDDTHEHKNKRSCPLTCNDLESPDIFDNSVKVGEQTVLFMPSFWCCIKPQRVSSPVDFKVIERTNLGSLNEGVIFGPSYIVTPSSCPESEDIAKSELNAQVFQGLCSVLHSLDQGLVCSSNCNIETLKQTSFQCYYILLPSDKGMMLLRRLAGSEEVVPTLDVHQLITSSAAKDIEDSVRTSLLKMEARDYNPVLHERGFHQKLNVLVKKSLQFGSLPQKLKETSHASISTQQSSPEEIELLKQAADIVTMEEELPQLESKSEEDRNSEHVAKDWKQLLGNEIPKINSVEETKQLKQAPDFVSLDEEITQLDPKAGEDNTTASIAEEWEQLIVNEIPKKHSPTCIAKPMFDQAVFSLPEIGNRHPDEKTSRILERLEVPRQMRKKLASPKVSSGIITEECVLIKKPLIPYGPAHAADQVTVGSQSSQPMKPNFQKLKRKLR